MFDNPRLRLLVGNHWRPLVGGLVAVALLSFLVAGLAYADRPTETVTQRTHEQTVVTTASTSAVVTGGDALWPEGTRLEDKPVYLTNASPTMTVTADTNVSGADDATVRHEWLLVVRATRGGEEFWSETETLAAATHDGDGGRTEATVDVPQLRERVERVEATVGSAGSVSVHLQLRVEYETDPGEAHGYTNAETLSTPLTLDGQSYAVAEEDLQHRADHSTPVTTEVAAPRNWSWLAALVAVGLAALAAAGAILRQDPEDIDLEAARNERHRRQYAQWISPGVIPMGIEQQFIELESLEGVVDVAIDTNERVVYDGRRDLYAVISDNVAYYFSPGGSWMATAFPGIEVPEEADDGPSPGSFEDALDEDALDTDGSEDPHDWPGEE